MNSLNFKRWFALLLTSLFFSPVWASTLTHQNEKSPVRIVSIGSAVTDLVVALGGTSQLVAVDSTSEVPDSAQVKTLGYQRQLSAEGILSVKPTLVIGSDEMGPPEAIRYIRQAHVPVITLSSKATLAALKGNIKNVAQMLGHPKRGQALIENIDTQIDGLASIAKTNHTTHNSHESTLFLLILGSGTPQVAGSGTVANRLIDLAGGDNPAASLVSGYKPMSQESLLKMQPNVLLVSQRILDSFGGVKGLIQHYPILAATPAGKDQHIYGVDYHALIGGLSLATIKEAKRIAPLLAPNNISGSKG
ncbi:ABC transporter substrate-binding protein [Vibrio profundum]|uniref:heme/hemin ABC transporter substrate-binding protein n=1 Tax=Vibrio profundum TaxID=2910247 RepID=UPI003D118517